ncbi:hypothetical protein Patl1_37136 [Pistacia atlantica]|nr:hypothetical protein Patl1_37136 [Pistacia atlantica]
MKSQFLLPLYSISAVEPNFSSRFGSFPIAL